MSIQSYERFQFSQILLDAFRSLGSQLVVALKNLWLIDGQEKAYNQLYGLNDVVFEISKGLDQPHLLETIIQKATQLLSAQGGAIYLLDSRQKQLELKAATGLSKQMNGHIISRDEGLCGRILKTGRAQVRHNYRQWKHRLEELDSLEFKAVAGSLIKMGDRPLGVIIVDDTRPDKKFYPEDLKILQVFANHAGLALQRAEFFEKEQVIHKIVSAITSDSDLESVFSYICLAAFELFGVDHSGLVLFDNSYDWGTVAGEYPSSIGALGARIRLSGVKAEEVLIQSAAPLNFPDLEQVKSDLGEVYELMHGFNIFSTLIVPIEYQGRVLGSFSLDTISRYRNFELEEIELCKVFALTVATAIENARLLKELHKQGNYIRSLFKASTSVFSTNEPNDIIQQIVETTRKATGAWKVAVILTSPNNDPEYIVHSGFDEDIKAITTMRSGGISEQVLRDGTPEFFGNISEHRSGVNPNMIADDVKAAACLPLSSRDRRLGILWVQFSSPKFFHKKNSTRSKFLPVKLLLSSKTPGFTIKI